MRRHSIALLSVVVGSMVVLGLVSFLGSCSKSSNRAMVAPSTKPGLLSNVNSIRIDSGTILDAESRTPFSGVVIARDNEIAAFTSLALDSTPLAAASSVNTTGFAVVLTVRNGLLEGPAELHVHGDAGQVPTVLERLRPLGEIGGSFRLATAAFVSGRLEGTAVVHDPRPEHEGLRIAAVRFSAGVLDGKAEEFFDGKAQLKREVHFKKGVQSGLAREFFDDGALASTTEYSAGERHGLQEAFYANGKPRSRATFVRGAKTGVSRGWFPDGKKHWEVEHDGGGRERRWFSNGSLQLDTNANAEPVPPDGLVVEYHPNGKPRSRTNYREGVRHRGMEVFYADGSIRERASYEAGRLEGPHLKWWKNGNRALESMKIRGQLQGQFVRWYAKGNKWEQGAYAAGERVGNHQKWWKNGAQAEDAHYTNGKLDGEFRSYYDNGKRWVVATYSDGKPAGTIKRWFPNGTLGVLKEHENGVPHGAHKRWYANGNKRLEASYHRGHLEGAFENWLEDGTVYESATFRRGRRVKSSRVKR